VTGVHSSIVAGSYPSHLFEMSTLHHERKDNNHEVRFSGLWALVNNEQWTAFGEVEWLPWEIFRHSLDVNVLGAIRITQAFLPLIRKAKGNTASVFNV